MKRKSPMPSYYGKNIAQHAQRRFLARYHAAGSAGAVVERMARGKVVRILIADETGHAPGREQ